jgi:hypothetical protein
MSDKAKLWMGPVILVLLFLIGIVFCSSCARPRYSVVHFVPAPDLRCPDGYSRTFDGVYPMDWASVTRNNTLDQINCYREHK